MLTRKCDICGREIRRADSRYVFRFDGVLYSMERDMCFDCYKRIRDEMSKADTPKMERSIEADKVVEALKICDHNSDGEPCKTCPYRDAKWGGAWESEDGEWCCYKQLAADAISLIERTERSEE